MEDHLINEHSFHPSEQGALALRSAWSRGGGRSVWAMDGIWGVSELKMGGKASSCLLTSN